MPRHASGPLDRLEITSPCPADWDSMKGNDRVRFCEHCSLRVQDVSAMTPAQALGLVRGSRGRLCLRLHRRADGSVVTRPLPQSLHQIRRRVSRVAAGAFGAAFGLCAAAAAHAQTAPAAPAPAAVAEMSTLAPAVSSGRGALFGTVTDEAQAAVVRAVVHLRNEQTGFARGGYTNSEGFYIFDSLEAGTYTVRFESTGFATQEWKGVPVRADAGQSADATLVVEQTVTMGAVAIDPQPSEPLVRAAYADDLAEVRRLLAGGADANAADKQTGTTALAQAVSNGNREMVVELLRAGAEVNARMEHRQTALMLLSMKTSEEVVRELLLAGAKVDARDEYGFTALMAAAGWGAPGIVEMLLRAGAKVNARNKSGTTPLMHAALTGRSDNARALVSGGADLDRRDETGSTALMLARQNEHQETADLLLAYGATEDEPQETPEEAAAQP